MLRRLGVLPRVLLLGAGMALIPPNLLANIIAVELVGVADADSSLGTITERKLGALGKYFLTMGSNFLQYPQERGDPDIPIKQRHVIQNGKLFLIELVKMSALKAVQTRVWI